MEFRWLIILSIYTLLIGPVLDMPRDGVNAKQRQHAIRSPR